MQITATRLRFLKLRDKAPTEARWEEKILLPGAVRGKQARLWFQARDTHVPIWFFFRFNRECLEMLTMILTRLMLRKIII